MSSSFIVLSEVPIDASDAMTALGYLGLGPEDDDTSAEDAAVTPHRVRVVIPRDTERSLVAEVIDALGMADLRGAWEAIVERARRERTADTARADADAVLATVVDAFERVGCRAEGSLSEDDPLPAVRRLLDDCESQAVVVFSDPQLLEETFAQDWAHKVEDELHATVLHLYPGSPTIGTS